MCHEAPPAGKFHIPLKHSSQGEICLRDDETQGETLHVYDESRKKTYKWRKQKRTEEPTLIATIPASMRDRLQNDINLNKAAHNKCRAINDSISIISKYSTLVVLRETKNIRT